MTVTETSIPGVKILEPRLFPDGRGYFCETYSRRDFEAKVAPGIIFVQDNESRSRRGVVRGLHFQAPPFAQAKLVRVVEGRIVDIALDIRVGSPTYGRHVAVELSADNHRQLFLPAGIAHGFAVLSEWATFLYKVDNFYAPQADGGISVTDPLLGIEWPFSLSEAILSDKDLRHPVLSQFTSPFNYE